jgi:hypothetical protein
MFGVKRFLHPSHSSLQFDLSVKVLLLNKDKKEKAEILSKGRLLSQLYHPSLSRLIDVVQGSQSNFHFFIIESI